MITEIREIFALAVRALALYMSQARPRKRIYLHRRDDSWTDPVKNVWAGRKGFVQLRKVRSLHKPER